MRSLLAVVAFVPWWTGCAAPDATDPELDTEPMTGEEIAADAPFSGSYSFYKITADLRKCPSPECGGWFVQPLNHSMMRCWDGEYRESCYTAWLDWSASGLGDKNKQIMLAACERGASAPGVVAIVRGHWHPIGYNERYSSYGTFDLREAWVAEPGAPSDGEFVRIKDNGIRCIVAPCPHLDETRLNSKCSTAIDELDFRSSGLDQKSIEALAVATESPDGILVAGYRYEVFGNGHGGLGRTITAGYRRLVERTCTAAGFCP